MRSVTVLLLALALAGGACSTADPSSNLDDTVAAQGEAQEALRRQLTELQTSVQNLLSTDQSGDVQSLATTLTELQESIAGLDTLSTELDDRLTEAETGLTSTSETVTTLDGELDTISEQLAQLVSAVDGLRGSVGDLGDDLGSLETQFQRHRDDENAHGGGRR